MSLTFDNSLLRELPGEDKEHNLPRQVRGAVWSPVTPTPVADPKLVAFSREMAQELGIDEEFIRSQQTVSALAGNDLLPGMKTYSLCYGGHQFGDWAGQLGDGRAINLGEVVAPSGKRWVLQLKGAGPTPYSRHADGRAVLRSSVREFVCSEAMFHLGVPTTRALSLVETGDRVIRDMFYDGRPAPEPGAIVCRVSPSFMRFGNFEIFAARNELELLQELFDFVQGRDFPELDAKDPERVSKLFNNVCRRTAVMVSHWMRVGFVHGVMNTDNMSILGLTIDYGPYGWLDNYDPVWTPNTTDLPGRRYRFGQQPQVALWNLVRLANALAALVDDPEVLREGLELYAHTYEEESHSFTCQKFGLPPEEDDLALQAQAYQLMEKTEVDMTLFFRAITCGLEQLDWQRLGPAFYDEEKRARDREEWESWLEGYRRRLTQLGEATEVRVQRMTAVNPVYVPRNYLLQEAIELAEEGDYSRIEQLLELFRDPYVDQAGMEQFRKRRPEWAREKPGCSMLSCSS